MRTPNSKEVENLPVSGSGSFSRVHIMNFMEAPKVSLHEYPSQTDAPVTIEVNKVQRAVKVCKSAGADACLLWLLYCMIYKDSSILPTVYGLTIDEGANEFVAVLDVMVEPTYDQSCLYDYLYEEIHMSRGIIEEWLQDTASLVVDCDSGYNWMVLDGMPVLTDPFCLLDWYTHQQENSTVCVDVAKKIIEKFKLPVEVV